MAGPRLDNDSTGCWLKIPPWVQLPAACATNFCKHNFWYVDSIITDFTEASVLECFVLCLPCYAKVACAANMFLIGDVKNTEIRNNVVITHKEVCK